MVKACFPCSVCICSANYVRSTSLSCRVPGRPRKVCTFFEQVHTFLEQVCTFLVDEVHQRSPILDC